MAKDAKDKDATPTEVTPDATAVLLQKIAELEKAMAAMQKSSSDMVAVSKKQPFVKREPVHTNLGNGTIRTDL